jgi:hypothetical protein
LGRGALATKGSLKSHDNFCDKPPQPIQYHMKFMGGRQNRRIVKSPHRYVFQKQGLKTNSTSQQSILLTLYDAFIENSTNMPWKLMHLTEKQKLQVKLCKY